MTNFGYKFQVPGHVVRFNGLAAQWNIARKENLSFLQAHRGGRVPYRYLNHGGV